MDTYYAIKFGGRYAGVDDTNGEIIPVSLRNAIWFDFELEAMRFMPGEVVEFMYDVNTDTLTEAL